MKKTGCLTLLLLCLASEVFAHSRPGILKFGIFPFKSPRATLAIFAPVAHELEKKLGMKVQIVTAADAPTYLQKGASGDYDLAMPCVACLPVFLPAGYEVIARGTPDFYGGVIVRQESGITNLSQFKGRKIAAVAAHSYGGYLFFREQLAEQGLAPGKDFDVHFLGKPDTIIYGVANRQYDGGVIRVETLGTPSFAGVRDSLRLVSRSVPIPQFPFVVKKTLPAETAQLIRQVLTSLSASRDDEKAVLDSLQIKEIIPARDEDYTAILALIAKTGELVY